MFQLMMSLDRSAGSRANGLGWIRSSTQVQYQADVCAAVYFDTARPCPTRRYSAGDPAPHVSCRDRHQVK
jgi:hypothetical protein